MVAAGNGSRVRPGAEGRNRWGRVGTVEIWGKEGEKMSDLIIFCRKLGAFWEHFAYYPCLHFVYWNRAPCLSGPVI